MGGVPWKATGGSSSTTGPERRGRFGERGELRVTFTAEGLWKSFHLLVVKEREGSSGEEQF